MQRLTITGAIDGVNDTFTLSPAPSSLHLYRNGTEQSPAGVDFTLTGATVVFVPAAIPQTGDTLVAIDATGSKYLVITGAIDGANDTFTLNAIPLFLALVRNGLLQSAGVDYVLTSNQIVFTAGSIPGTGDILLAITDAATAIPTYTGTVTVQEIYDVVCDVLMEPGGLVLGTYTEASFLHDLANVMLDFAQRAPLEKQIFTEMINAGVADYLVPETIMEPQLCFVGGKLIEKTTEDDLVTGHLEWRREWGPPQQWHEDNLEIKHLELYPKPDCNGTNIAGSSALVGKFGDFYPTERNLTIVGPAAPSQTAWTLASTLDGISASFSHYIVYGILAQVFSSDSELRDTQRALYARTRYLEGAALAQAIAREDLLEDQDED